MSQPTLETWEMKVRRLALDLKRATPKDPTPTRAERLRYRQARYALQRLLDEVELGDG